MKFIVYVKEVHVLPVEIEASSDAEAVMLVKEAIANNEVDLDCLEYSHTLDSSEWRAENQKNLDS
jgi:hypothetical protein